MGTSTSTDYAKSLTYIQKLIDTNFGQIQVYRNQDGKFIMKNYRSFITGDKRFQLFKKLLQFIRTTQNIHIVTIQYIEQQHQSSVCIEYDKVFIYTQYLNFTLKGLIINKKILQESQIWYCMKSLIQLVVQLQKNKLKICLSLDNIFLTLKGIPSIFMYHIYNDQKSQKLQQIQFQKNQIKASQSQMHNFPHEIIHQQSMFMSIGKIILQLYTMRLIDEQQQMLENNKQIKNNHIYNLLNITNNKNKLLGQFIEELFFIKDQKEGQALLTKLSQIQESQMINLSSQIRFNKFRYVVADDQKIKNSHNNQFNQFDQLKQLRNPHGIQNNQNKFNSENKNNTFNKNMRDSLKTQITKNISSTKAIQKYNNNKFKNTKNLMLFTQDKQLFNKDNQKQQFLNINDLKTPIAYLKDNNFSSLQKHNLNQKQNIKNNQISINQRFFKQNKVDQNKQIINKQKNINTQKDLNTQLIINKHSQIKKIKNKLSLSSNKNSLRQSIQKNQQSLKNSISKDKDNSIIKDKSINRNKDNSISPKYEKQKVQNIQITDYDMISTTNINQFNSVSIKNYHTQENNIHNHEQLNQQKSNKIYKKNYNSSILNNNLFNSNHNSTILNNSKNKQNTQYNGNNLNIMEIQPNQIFKIKSQSNTQAMIKKNNQNHKNNNQNNKNNNFKPFFNKQKNINNKNNVNKSHNKFINNENYYDKLIANKFKLSKPQKQDQINYKTQQNYKIQNQNKQYNKNNNNKNSKTIINNSNNKSLKKSIKDLSFQSKILKINQSHNSQITQNKNQNNNNQNPLFNSNINQIKKLSDSHYNQIKNQKKSFSFFNSLDKSNFLSTLQSKKLQNQIKNKLITQRKHSTQIRDYIQSKDYTPQTKESILIISNHYTAPDQIISNNFHYQKSIDLNNKTSINITNDKYPQVTNIDNKTNKKFTKQLYNKQNIVMNNGNFNVKNIKQFKRNIRENVSLPY